MAKKTKKNAIKKPVKVKKKRVKHFEPGFFADKPLANSSGVLTRSVFSIDQSYTSVGLSFLFINATRSEIIDFAASAGDVCPRFFDFVRRPSFNEGQLFYETPEGNKKKPRSYSYIFNVNQTTVNAIFYASLSYSNEEKLLPEWELSERIAQKIKKLANAFFISQAQRDLSLTFEGLAMGGIATAPASLPALGILYGSLWRVLSPLTKEYPNLRLKEVPISTWKKQFAGHGHADKKEIAAELKNLGIYDFETNDESDAVAMSLIESSLRIGKETKGRLRPIPNSVVLENSGYVDLTPIKTLTD